MWKDTWYLTKRNLSDSKFYMILNFLAFGWLFLVIAGMLLPEQNKYVHLGHWIITFTILFLISLPFYVKRHHNSYARIKDDLSRREFAFFRTFPIDPRAMVYSRILISLLVGCIYLILLLPISYIGLKEYYHLTDIKILGIILLILALAILLNTILLYLELMFVYVKFFWLSLIPFFLFSLVLYIVQSHYGQNIIELTATIVDLITIVGCFTILFITVANLIFVTCTIIQHVRLK